MFRWRVEWEPTVKGTVGLGNCKWFAKLFIYPPSFSAGDLILMFFFFSFSFLCLTHTTIMILNGCCLLYIARNGLHSFLILYHII